MIVKIAPNRIKNFLFKIKIEKEKISITSTKIIQIK